MNKISGVYGIRSIVHPERIYIGSSIDINKRWREHLRRLKRGDHINPKLQCHVSKYGESDLIFELIIQCDPVLVVNVEQYFINTFQPWFNISPTAGSSMGIKRSGEYIEAMSRRRLGQLASEETRERMRKAHLNISNETREKIRRAGMGRVFSAESIEKMRKSALGVHPSEETRQKMRDAKKGKKLANEHKRKISENSGAAKLIINIETGIFYNTIIDAAMSVCKPDYWLSDRLRGRFKNNTMFRYA